MGMAVGRWSVMLVVNDGLCVKVISVVRAFMEVHGRVSIVLVVSVVEG